MKKMKKKVIKHLKEDIKTFHKEAKEDKELIKDIKKKKKKKKKAKGGFIESVPKKLKKSTSY